MLSIQPMVDGLKLPDKDYEGDAGWNLYSLDKKVLQPGEHFKFKLGFRIIGESGWVYLTQARSSYAINYGINVIGNVIDSGYRGEVSVILQNSNTIGEFEVNIGDKIAQLLVMPVDTGNSLLVHGALVKQLELKTRADKGYGSSGK